MDFDDLSLGTPARRALAEAGVTSFEEAAARTRAEIAALKGVGPRALSELEGALEAHGLGFAGEVVEPTDSATPEPAAVPAVPTPAATAPAATPPASAAPAYNVFAIVALASAFVIPILGIVFGHLALRELKTSGQQGREMAIAGLVIGYALSAVYLVTIFATIAFSFMMMLVPFALIPISMMG